MQPVQLHSTALRTLAYQDDLRRLELEFRSGAVYHYFQVSQSTCQALLQAESKGAFFNQYIRNRYPSAKIRPAAPPRS